MRSDYICIYIYLYVHIHPIWIFFFKIYKTTLIPCIKMKGSKKKKKGKKERKREGKKENKGMLLGINERTEIGGFGYLERKMAVA